VVTGATTAVTDSTGVEDTTTGLAATGSATDADADADADAATGSEAEALAARLVLGAGVTAAATGAGVATAGVESTGVLFFATRLGVEVEADIIPEDEELELILIRIILAYKNQFYNFFVNFWE